MTAVLVRVGDLAQQIRGVTYSKTEAASAHAPGLLPVLRAGNITDHGLTFTDLVFVPESRVNARQRIHRHDVLIAASSGSLDVVGKAGQAVDDFAGGFGAFCKVLRPNERVDPNYFAHFFKTAKYRRTISSLAAGANINNLRSQHLDDLTIPLPSIVEQRRIAAILDQADALRAKRSEAIAHLDDLTHSIFLDMFGDPVENRQGWPRTALGNLLRDIESGHSPICLPRPAKAQEWGVLKLGAVTYCRYDPTENKAMRPETAPRGAHEVKVGDLLFARKNTRDLVGATALVRSTPPRMLLPDLIFRLQLREGAPVDKTFLHQLLTWPTKRKQIQALANGSAGSMPNISKARLQTAAIETPPIAVQREFARRVLSVEGLRQTNHSHLVELNGAFASLQSRAFAGEL